MFEQRVVETIEGIIGEEQVEKYDAMQKQMRDIGLLVTDDIIQSDLNKGTALEIGPGPGYLGLEWLKKTDNTNLYWLEISGDMMNVAQKNAGIYNFENRINCILADATRQFPLEDDFFDGVFTNGSLHEWDNPVNVFNEIYRVLKSGGKFFVCDLKRNTTPEISLLMRKNLNITGSSEIGFKKSIEAAYLKGEVIDLLSSSKLKNFYVAESPFGLTITGYKD